MRNYEEVINEKFKFSSKAIENLELNGIYEFQRSNLKPGWYDIFICRQYQTDDIVMYLNICRDWKKEEEKHLFTFILPNGIREIKIGKNIIVIKFL